jgi:hypothetical protein
VPPSAGVVSPEIQRIIESVFDVNVEPTWAKLHAFIKAHETPGAYSARSMLREVEDRCREAHKIYCVLKLELERYKGDVEATRAAMRAEASESLQAEKDMGERKKAITEADIKAKMIELHPDEYRSAEMTERKFSLAVEHAERILLVLTQKSRSLNTEVGRGVSSGADD